MKGYRGMVIRVVCVSLCVALIVMVYMAHKIIFLAKRLFWTKRNFIVSTKPLVESCLFCSLVEEAINRLGLLLLSYLS